MSYRKAMMLVIELRGGKYISQARLKADNVENPVFSPPPSQPGLFLLFLLLQRRGFINPSSAPMISRKEGSALDGTAGRRSHAHRMGGGGPPGD